MSYLEELLPEFRKGVKIRMKNWPKPFYYQMKKGRVYNQDGYIVKNLSQHTLFQREWEFYQDPEPDWQYIIDHKCPCLFWNSEDDTKIDFLTEVNDNIHSFVSRHSGFINCRPIRRDEVTFYEDREDE